MPKLTLKIDADVIQQAKQLAQQHGTSVSAMFTEFITESATRVNLPQLGPLTRQALGIISLPSHKPDRKLIEEALLKRFV